MTDDRLRALLDATQTIARELELPAVLRRVVETSCALTGARYGALGVVDPDGPGLQQFIRVGLGDEDVRAIGALPTGRGLLGALLEDHRPIRLDRLGDHPRAVGFPPGHPPMTSFLGVPIRVGTTVYGNLYLTEAAAGRFTGEDEAVIVSLAAFAGVAIQNARLFAEADRRAAWLRASAEVTRQTVAAAELDDALRTVVATVHRLASADVACVAVPAGRGLLVTEVAGAGGDALRGARLSSSGSAAEAVLSGAAVLIEDGPDGDAELHHLLGPSASGPAMVVPLKGRDRVRGVLVAARRRGGLRFSDADLATATSFAHHAALAMEVADSRQDRERIAVLEDRTRIARDLHDHVIQQLFGAGMLLESLRGAVAPERQPTMDRVVDRLDEAVRQIRTSIFQLRPHALGGGSLRAAVLDVVDDVAPALGFTPRVDVQGPVDSVCDEALLDDVVAVVRESLCNTAKHAEAGAAAVSVRASADRLQVVVSDDGVGVASSHRSGLANLRKRAESYGGWLTVSSAPEGRGTVVGWTVPLA